MVLNLLARYVENTPDKSEIDARFEKALGNSPESRTAATRIVRRFQRRPIEQRQAIFGPLAELRTEKFETERSSAAARRLLAEVRAKGFRMIPQTPNPGIRITLPETTNVAIQYNGYWCVEETDGPGDDDFYLITNVITHNAAGDMVVKTVKHPVSGRVYESIDEDEWNAVADWPQALCWTGPAQDLSLVAFAWENDEGDPDAYKDDVHAVVVAIATAAEAAGYPIPDFAQDAVTEVVNFLLGTEDDEIGRDGRNFTKSQLIEMADTNPWYSQPFYAHFQTIHKENGEYRIYYQVKKQ